MCTLLELGALPTDLLTLLCHVMCTLRDDLVAAVQSW